MNRRAQRDLGELSAMEWLGRWGARVWIPLSHSPDVDLIAEKAGRLHRVQVKTSTLFRKARWEVAICTRGGNQSWSGVTKLLDPTKFDYLFVLVGDGRRWFIPSRAIEGRLGLLLGGPKYAAYEVSSAPPLIDETDHLPLSRIGSPAARGDARAVKGIAL